MNVRARLRVWRRRWCMLRRHPLRYVPVVVYRDSNGNTYEQRAVRCELHDRPTR